LFDAKKLDKNIFSPACDSLKYTLIIPSNKRIEPAKNIKITYPFSHEKVKKVWI